MDLHSRSSAPALAAASLDPAAGPLTSDDVLHHILGRSPGSRSIPGAEAHTGAKTCSGPSSGSSSSDPFERVIERVEDAIALVRAPGVEIKRGRRALVSHHPPQATSHRNNADRASAAPA